MGVGTYLSLSMRGREAGWECSLIRRWEFIKFLRLQDGRLFEVGAYSRWALIQGWVLIRINTVYL